MSVISISGGITAHVATPAPELTKEERDPVLDLVRAWEDSAYALSLGIKEREALIRRIITHTRQAVSEAEKRADELERLLTNAIEKLDEFDVRPCSSCHALVSRNAERTVDAAGFYCSLDCGVTAGALCWQCSKPTDGEEDGLCSSECARKAAAEDQANG